VLGWWVEVVIGTIRWGYGRRGCFFVGELHNLGNTGYY
jgi:hypothetical protein